MNSVGSRGPDDKRHGPAGPLIVGPIDKRRGLAIDSAGTNVFYYARYGDERSRDIALTERAAKHGRRRVVWP